MSEGAIYQGKFLFLQTRWFIFLLNSFLKLLRGVRCINILLFFPCNFPAFNFIIYGRHKEISFKHPLAYLFYFSPSCLPDFSAVRSLFGNLILACNRQISFYSALNFSPDYPYPTTKFALINPPKADARFRLRLNSRTNSKFQLFLSTHQPQKEKKKFSSAAGRFRPPFPEKPLFSSLDSSRNVIRLQIFFALLQKMSNRNKSLVKNIILYSYRWNHHLLNRKIVNRKIEFRQKI